MRIPFNPNQVSSKGVLTLSLMLLVCTLTALWQLHKLTVFLTNHPLFEAVTFVLAWLAITFAFVQFRDAQKHSHRMDEHSCVMATHTEMMSEHRRRIEQIARSMSTRYIGEFPRDIGDIAEVVTAARTRLVVVADYVSYGHFSNPEDSSRLVEALNKAIVREVDIRMLVYDRATAAKALRRQFPEQTFSELVGSEVFNHYFSKHYRGVPIPTRHSEFIERLICKMDESAQILVEKGARVKTLSDDAGWLFFWLEDDQDAAFSFQRVGQSDQSLSFRTRDAKLIETFSGIFGTAWDAAPDWQPQPSRSSFGPSPPG